MFKSLNALFGPVKSSFLPNAACYRSKQGILRILTFDIDHLTLKKLSKKLETYFFEVLIQNWSRKIMSPTINMNFPRKLHKLPDYNVQQLFSENI